MAKYRVNVIELSGIGKKVHKSNEVLEADQVPGGEANAEKLVKSGHLVVVEGSEDSDDDSGSDDTTGSGDDDTTKLEPKDAADALIDEAKELEEGGDLLGAMEKLNAVLEVYPNGKKAPKLIKEIQGKIGKE